MNLKIGITGLFTVALAAIFFTSCNKTDDACVPKTPQEEDAAMQTFMRSIGMNGTKAPEGYYYEIINEGSTGRPTANSVIAVTYKGTRFDGTVFDEQTNPGRTNFQLSQMIDGWKYAIPRIGKDGRINLVIPSSMGYGCSAAGDIAPNTPLYFEVNLVDFY